MELQLMLTRSTTEVIHYTLDYPEQAEQAIDTVLTPPFFG